MRSLVAFILTIFFLGHLIGCAEKSDLIVPNPSPHTIHVAVGGYDSSPGSADRPLYSLSKALELAISTGAREIKIGQGEYSGISQIIGGIDLVGGLDPLTWEKIPGGYSSLFIQNDSVLAQDIQKPTLISSLEFHPWGSQVPVSLFGCGPDLHFVDCKFEALDSPDGWAGGDGYDGPSQNTNWPHHDGGPGHCLEDIEAPGGTYGYIDCNGGDGGSPGEPGSNGNNANSRDEDYPDSGLGGAGGLPGQPGQDGSPGADGPWAENGILPAGRIYLRGTTLSTFYPQHASGGRNGYRGGGGGGGGGSASGTGNGGGAGGNGGRQGQGGNGGNNAYPCIAVICSNTLAQFSGCTFKTHDGGTGGAGGNGGLGNLGLAGGLGGTECSPEVGAGGNGGLGGKGSDGGGGAGGYGGDSIGLWVLGNLVPGVNDDCVFEIGQPGPGGLGGLHGDGNSRAPSGLDGRRADILVESDPQ